MFLLVALVIVVISLLVFSLTKRKHPTLIKLPGPKPNFFFGNYVDFIGATTSGILNTIQNYIEEYGSIVRIHDGPFSTTVGVTDPDFMQYILSSTKLIDKACQYEYFHNWLGTGLLTSTGSKWKKRRRMLTPSFHFSILENFIEVFDNVSDILIRKMEERIGESSVDIYPMITLCTLDIICEAAMGIPINAQVDEHSEYVQSVKTMCSIITDRNFSALDPKFYPLTLNYFREKAALKILHTHTDKVIDERIKSKKLALYKGQDETKGRQAFLDLLLKFQIDGESLSRLDIREEVDTFMFEGHDTTSSALSFTIYSLATNPEVQKKAYEEQLDIFGDRKNPKITMVDLQNMKYLDLVIKETLRLYPSVPLIARKVAEDFEYNGVIYPRGLTITLLPFFAQRDPKYFHDPEKFVPERFIESDGKHPYAYVPFSAGPRNCIGQKFAVLEIKSAVSKILRNFELLPAQPEHKLELAPEVILISRNGIKISLQKRKSDNDK